jgi:hypothetical protein
LRCSDGVREIPGNEELTLGLSEADSIVLQLLQHWFVDLLFRREDNTTLKRERERESRAESRHNRKVEMHASTGEIPARNDEHPHNHKQSNTTNKDTQKERENITQEGRPTALILPLRIIRAEIPTGRPTVIAMAVSTSFLPLKVMYERRS